MKFFKSNNVKIFPCYTRGGYSSKITNTGSATGNTTISEFLDVVFDPEANLLTEQNFINSSGKVLGMSSYVVEWNSTASILNFAMPSPPFIISAVAFS